MKSQVEKLVQMQKESENEKDESWKTVQAKGKKKVGYPEDTGPSSPKGTRESTSEVAGEASTIQLVDLSTRKSLLQEINNVEGTLEMQNEILSIAQIVCPNVVQLMEEVECEILAAKSTGIEIEVSPSQQIAQPKEERSSGGKKKKAAGKGSSSQKKKQRSYYNV